MVDIRKSIEAKSDRLNADDLLGGSITIQIEDVRAGNADNPVAVFYAGCNGKPWYPCKTMRRAMVAAWSDDGKSWIGKSCTLYRDADVIYGGVKVGGIRISHFSDIDADMVLSLSEKRGKKAQYRFKRLIPPQSQMESVPLSQCAEPSTNADAERAMSAMDAAETLDRLTAITGSKKYVSLVAELQTSAPETHTRLVDCARKNAERLNEKEGF